MRSGWSLTGICESLAFPGEQEAFHAPAWHLGARHLQIGLWAGDEG